MLAPKSTHKRKRSSARSDKARKLGPSRWIVNLLPSQSIAEEATRSLSNVGPFQNRRLEKMVDAHPFNRSLELILPLSSDSSEAAVDADFPLPSPVQSLIDRISALAASHRSYRARVPLSLLLDPIFVAAYLKTGSLIALSDASGAPGFTPTSDDTVCLDGQGTLVLSLCKDTYQTLGLTGRASHFSRLSSGRAADRTSGPDSRFIVELPLLSPSFVPGKKGYQQALDRIRAWDQSRAQASAKEHTIAQTHASSKISRSSGSKEEITSEHATWDMHFVWSPSRAAVESNTRSTVDNEIRFPEHLVRPQDVESIPLQPLTPVITDSVWIPTPTEHPLSAPWRENERHFTELEPSQDSTQASWTTYQDGLQEAIEWAGLASLGAPAVRTFNKPDATCVYSPPRPSQPGRIFKLTIAGSSRSPLLLNPLLISQIAAQVDRIMSLPNSTKGDAERVEWATLSCAGFPHAPLTWRAKVPLSSRYGAKELPGSKTNTHLAAAAEDAEMEDASSSSEEESGEDSDASLDMGDIDTSKRRKKKRSKRNVGKNQTEHTFTPNTGETGWVSFCLKSKAEKKQTGRWAFVELVGSDTRS
ncbi:hypothetical protein NDA13_000278 [Ustilago tritici]|nr:hypothetical protein NDA13_000278 [Ustilago tritici]